METIQWWWVSSPCLCNLSLRHTEISSLITDYYHKGDVVWSRPYNISPPCVALTDVMLVALLIATSRGGIRIGSLMHSFFITCFSRHMWFFEKIFPAQMFELLEFSQFRSSSEKTNSSVRSHENAKCSFRFYSIAAIKRFSSEFHSVVLKFFFGFPRLYSRNWTD